MFVPDSGDFQPLSNQMLTIPLSPTDSSVGCLPVTILGDSVEEDDETFSVSISVAGPHTVTPPATVTVTIMDDNDGTFNGCVDQALKWMFESTLASL